MNEVADPLAKVWALQRELAKLPQIEAPTTHYFCAGMYARRLFLGAGWTIVGKQHKAEHFFVMLRGKLLVTDDDGETLEIHAGDVFVTRAGTKRAGHALEDSECITFHRTDAGEDIDAIELELIEPDETALLDANNRLRIA